jgi:hypothetical protein
MTMVMMKSKGQTTATIMTAMSHVSMAVVTP